MQKLKISLESIITFTKQFLVAILAALLVLSVYHQSVPHFKVVTVDVTGLSKEYLKTLAEKSLTEKDSLNAIQDYANRVEILLQKITLDNHWIILPKEAVMKGAKDITEEVQVLLTQSME